MSTFQSQKDLEIILILMFILAVVLVLISYTRNDTEKIDAVDYFLPGEYDRDLISFNYAMVFVLNDSSYTRINVDSVFNKDYEAYYVLLNDDGLTKKIYFKDLYRIFYIRKGSYYD